MMQKQSTVSMVVSRLATVGLLFRHFSHRRRLFMMPLLLFLMVSGVLLVVTGGLSYVAPFVYAVF
ncbi:DUF5989 family protein [Sorangium sp. So ce134]